MIPFLLITKEVKWFCSREAIIIILFLLLVSGGGLIWMRDEIEQANGIMEDLDWPVLPIVP